jgi:putative FmdB family regulatory protein
MPIFDFRCKECNQVFERLVRSSTAEAPECPQCGGQEVTRLVSLFAAQAPGAMQGPMQSRPSGGGCGRGGCGCH